MQRRALLFSAALLGATTNAALAATTATPAPQPVMQVWKDTSCGCCKDWIAYLEANGFTVRAFDTGNTDVVQYTLRRPE